MKTRDLVFWHKMAIAGKAQKNFKREKKTMKTRIVDFWHHKGGVGKSASSINVAYFLEQRGYKVLIVDADMQGNSVKFSELRVQTFCNCGTPTVTFEQYKKMKNTADYDFIIIDLPPTVTARTRNIIRQSDIVFVPTILGEFESRNIRDVSELVRELGTKCGGVFVTMFNAKNDGMVLSYFKTKLTGQLLKSVIPFSATVRESQKFGLPLEEYFNMRCVPDSGVARKVVIAYRELTNEILRRVEENV
jgi:chromosome partitioning protein